MLGRFAAIVVLVAASTSFAGPSAWSNASGDGQGFTWSNGQNNAGFYASPTELSDGFLFTGANFVANGSNGSSASLDEGFSVRLTADANKRFGKFKLDVFGDFAKLGDATLSASGVLKVTNLASNAVVQQALLLNPASPFAGGFGIFQGAAEVSLPGDWRDVLVQFNHNIAASSTPGATGHVESKLADLEVTVVPLPAATLIAPAAFGLMLWTRRRMMRRA